MPVLSYHHIKEYAAEAGFSLSGVARSRVLEEHGPRFAASLAASGEGALGYLVRDPARRLDPGRLVPGALTVVMCAMAYDPRPVETPDGLVSAHRRDGDYHPRIMAMLGAMLDRLRADVPGLVGRAFCDTSPILEKAWAVEAGLGWIGRNSLLVNLSLGSYLLLGGLVLAAPADRYDEPYSGSGCGACRRCVAACPAGALAVVTAPDTTESPSETPATVDTRRCISALTIESLRSGISPADPLHGWIYGCDVCQTVCPRQKKCDSPKKNGIFFENQ
ncbi:MAG: DUF1730 domain-containing protein [Alistipes sp.]|nr:DUF1730 domain-containing protein [Alistipes sp.]